MLINQLRLAFGALTPTLILFLAGWKVDGEFFGNSSIFFPFLTASILKVYKKLNEISFHYVENTMLL